MLENALDRQWSSTAKNPGGSSRGDQRGRGGGFLAKLMGRSEGTFGVRRSLWSRGCGRMVQACSFRSFPLG
jgi:hypothetical protein